MSAPTPPGAVPSDTPTVRFREMPGRILPFACPDCGTESFVVSDATEVETTCPVCGCDIEVWVEVSIDGAHDAPEKSLKNRSEATDTDPEGLGVSGESRDPGAS